MSKSKIPSWASKKQPKWTEFEEVEPGDFAGAKRTLRNSRYQVSIEEYKSGWTWLSIVRVDRLPLHDWRDLQRLKNEICGPEREAIELYPAESRLVDTNNQFHLWVMPEGGRAPVGYTERDVSNQTVGANKQRPFEVTPEGLNSKGEDDFSAVMITPPRLRELPDEQFEQREAGNSGK